MHGLPGLGGDPEAGEGPQQQGSTLNRRQSNSRYILWTVFPEILQNKLLTYMYIVYLLNQMIDWRKFRFFWPTDLCFDDVVISESQPKLPGIRPDNEFLQYKHMELVRIYKQIILFNFFWLLRIYSRS